LSEFGFQIAVDQRSDADRICNDLAALLVGFKLEDIMQSVVVTSDSGRLVLSCFLRPELRQVWMPRHDTLTLHEKLGYSGNIDTSRSLEREIWVALLGSPYKFNFASLDALTSHVRVRRNIAEASSKTALAFETEASERPEADWRYEEEAGFTLKPGRPLINALIAATQPDVSGKLYDFACYRATEYVILLGIAQELEAHHQNLLDELQRINEVYAIRSEQFHEVFMIEYGSMENPLPARFYVPGDRLWFRNPDAYSSDVTGFEGSWVIYMGGGLFSNFWVKNQPFTLETKAVEIFHWKDGVYVDLHGDLQMDESVVKSCVAQTLSDPQATCKVLERMFRMRDVQGIYNQGGCIDTTREYPRSVSQDNCELVLPKLLHKGEYPKDYSAVACG